MAQRYAGCGKGRLSHGPTCFLEEKVIVFTRIKHWSTTHEILS